MISKIFDKFWDEIISKKRVSIYLIGIFLLVNIALLVSPIAIDIRVLFIGDAPYLFISNLSKLILVASSVLFEFSTIMIFTYILSEGLTNILADKCRKKYWTGLDEYFSEKELWFQQARLGTESVIFESFEWLIVSIILLNILDILSYNDIYQGLAMFFCKHDVLVIFFVILNVLPIIAGTLKTIISLHYHFFHFKPKNRK